MLVAVAVDEEEAGQIADGCDDGGEVVAAGPEAFVGGGVAKDLLFINYLSVALQRK